jgi:hypothetical protein
VFNVGIRHFGYKEASVCCWQDFSGDYLDCGGKKLLNLVKFLTRKYSISLKNLLGGNTPAYLLPSSVTEKRMFFSNILLLIFKVIRDCSFVYFAKNGKFG